MQSLARLQHQKATLENLCRTLREQNQQFRTQLGIAPAPHPQQSAGDSVTVTPEGAASTDTEVSLAGSSVSAQYGSSEEAASQYAAASTADRGLTERPDPLQDPAASAALQSKVNGVTAGLCGLDISPEQ